MLEESKSELKRIGMMPTIVALCVVMILAIIVKENFFTRSAEEKAILALNPSEYEMIYAIDLAQNYDVIQSLKLDQMPKITPESVKQWQELSKEKKQKFKEQYKTFKTLTLDQQVYIRRNWHRFNKLSPDQQEVLRKKWQHWQTLGQVEQAKLKENWQKSRS